MSYRFEMALHQLLSALWPAALCLIIIGVGPFQICNTLQSHVIGILLLTTTSVHATVVIYSKYEQYNYVK